MNLHIAPREIESIDSIRSGTVRFAVERDAVDGFSPMRTTRRFYALNCVQQDDRKANHGAGCAATC